MSGGWIKLEKDLREDLRVKRMARLLGERHPALCNAGAFQDGVILITVVLGALAQLWMHADTFARDDDTLDITSAEIDQLAGIEDFSQILPGDWLEVLDPDCVKLPQFQEHNGSEAKRKAQTAKRVSKHRAEHQKRTSVTDDARPVTHERYQTRPDQDQTRPDQTSHEREASNGHGEGEAKDSQAPFCDPTGFAPLSLDQARQLQAAYPVGIYRQSEWLVAQRMVNHHLASGHAFDELLGGADRYREQCRARESIGTQYVLSPVKFFDRDAPQFADPFPLPRTKGEARQDANIDAAHKWLAQSEGK